MVAWAFPYWHTGKSRSCDKRMFFVSGVLCYTVHMVDTWIGTDNPSEYRDQDVNG